MNKIVREHYPAARLPEELRQGFSPDATVTIVIEEEESASEVVRVALGSIASSRPVPSMSVEETLESIRLYKATHPPLSDPDEPVRRIRALRDEWDDE